MRAPAFAFLFILMMTDIVMTQGILHYGGFEVNPLGKFIITNWGPMGMLGAKLLSFGIFASIVNHFHSTKQYRWEALVWGFAIGSLLGATMLNALTLAIQYGTTNQ